MKHSTTVKQTISGEAEAIWKTISKGGGVHQWFPKVIQSCEIKKADGKTSRSCTMNDGSHLKESIVEVSDLTRRFVYTVDEHPLPASDILTTIEIEDLGNKSTSVTWSSNFVADEENISIVEEMLQGIYMQGIKSLETWHCDTKEPIPLITEA